MKRSIYVAAAICLVSIAGVNTVPAGAPGGGASAVPGLVGGGGRAGGVGSGGAQSPPPKALYPDIKPVMTVDQLKQVKIENVTIESVTQGNDGSLRITATVTHPPAKDKVQVWIGLPANWNGRFQGTGGGGWSGGSAVGADAEAVARRTRQSVMRSSAAPVP